MGKYFKRIGGVLLALGLVTGGAVVVTSSPAFALTCEHLTSGGGNDNTLTTAGAVSNLIKVGGSNPTGYTNLFCFELKSGNGSGDAGSRYYLHVGQDTSKCVTRDTSANDWKVENCVNANNQLFADYSFAGANKYELLPKDGGGGLDDPTPNSGLHNADQSSSQKWGSSPNFSNVWLQQ